MEHNIEHISENLINKIKSESYKGFDPWDGLNSAIVDEKSMKVFKLFLFHFNSHFPINLRNLLKIKKSTNAKGLSLMLESYINFYKINKDERYLGDAEKIICKILKLRTKNLGVAAWGYPFPWETPHRSLKKYSPNVVTTAFVIRSLSKYLEISKNVNLSPLITSSAEFVTNYLNRTYTDDGVCFSYTPEDNYQVINASLLAAEILSSAYLLNGNSEYKNLCESALSFVFSNQREDGSWDYALSHKTGLGLEKGGASQVDWHQGFVLDSIFNINNNLSNNFDFIETPFMKGLLFYKKNQFLDSGQSFWRWPRLWPADIHNQAQGIISFSKYVNYDIELLDISNRILNWTLDNLYSTKSQLFYFRKWPLLTIKNDYMRYSQMWMANALSFYILSRKENY